MVERDGLHGRVAVAVSPGRPAAGVCLDAAATGRRKRTTAQMINDCFRHQHPEAYGGSPIDPPVVPPEVLFGGDRLVVASTVAVAEEAMGDPDSRRLD